MRITVIDVTNGKTVTRDMTTAEIATLQSTREQLAASAREKRNTLLAASDWTQVIDAPVDQTAWAVYRQALRDITAQAGFPTTIDWPVAP